MDAASKMTIERLQTQEKVLLRLLSETRMDLEAAKMIQEASKNQEAKRRSEPSRLADEMVAGMSEVCDAAEAKEPLNLVLAMEVEEPVEAHTACKSRTIQTEEDLEDEVAVVNNPIGDKPPRKLSALKRYILTGKRF